MIVRGPFFSLKPEEARRRRSLLKPQKGGFWWEGSNDFNGKRKTSEASMKSDRCIGDLGSQKGPVIIATGAIHGNEPAGALALTQVVRELTDHKIPLNGRFIALHGNLAAAKKNCRFIHEDLNRLWTTPRINKLRARLQNHEPHQSSEDLEQEELLTHIEAILKDLDKPVTFLDLHTMSGQGQPFAALGNTKANRALAKHLPMDQVLDIGKHIKGAMIGYFCEQGHTTFGIEAGQHSDPQSLKRHRAFLYMALDLLGLINIADCPFLNRDELLADIESHGLQSRLFEIFYRHSISPADKFKMEPGFKNFQEVYKGQILARDRNGEIPASEDAFMLLPLYQGQGNDGFFLAKQVSGEQ
jgi:succinylglutamate desuccinylase